ncbi:MAG: hypothetical protein WCJ62_11935 [Flavobacterium sp.]
MPDVSGAVKGTGGNWGALGGAVASTIVSSAFASADNRKQVEMQEKIALLSLAQQKQLEEHLQNVQVEVAKQKIIYDYLAVQNNNEMPRPAGGKEMPHSVKKNQQVEDPQDFKGNRTGFKMDILYAN